jgi:hypothetical protein
MVIGSGEAQCKGCGYEYKPGQGDPEFPVAKGTLFQVRPYHPPLQPHMPLWVRSHDGWYPLAAQPLWAPGG